MIKKAWMMQEIYSPNTAFVDKTFISIELSIAFLKDGGYNESCLSFLVLEFNLDQSEKINIFGKYKNIKNKLLIKNLKKDIESGKL
ncbi:MAG: hypothetical protein ACOCRX_07475 [Candidatus Woesearchaeota archaeon]